MVPEVHTTVPQGLGRSMWDEISGKDLIKELDTKRWLRPVSKTGFLWEGKRKYREVRARMPVGEREDRLDRRAEPGVCMCTWEIMQNNDRWRQWFQVKGLCVWKLGLPGLKQCWRWRCLTEVYRINQKWYNRGRHGHWKAVTSEECEGAGQWRNGKIRSKLKF